MRHRKIKELRKATFSILVIVAAGWILFWIQSRR